MTIGDGIFWSTVLVIVFSSVVLLTKHKQWKSFAKAFSGLLILAAFIGGSVWIYFEYQDRPYLVTSLNGLSLGMSELDVTLAKGVADDNAEDETIEGEYRKVLLYNDTSDSKTFINLSGKRGALVVTEICDIGGYGEVLGFGEYSSERIIRKKLGEPSHTSVKEDGTAKWMSYAQWNASYEIEKGKVTMACVSNEPNIYSTEYKHTTDHVQKAPAQ